ncbi:unnamed protein product, partial [Mesorhabditis belari]|uniref:Uncharacterized protein n=1 Tax=Mesorhabditis belari TaxID=2138241 RepID=A0AAF3J334_9BILA
MKQNNSEIKNIQVIQLKNIPVNTNWTGVTVLCQANYNGQPVDSSPAVVDVKFLRQPHVVDSNGNHLCNCRIMETGTFSACGLGVSNGSEKEAAVPHTQRNGLLIEWEEL